MEENEGNANDAARVEEDVKSDESMDSDDESDDDNANEQRVAELVKQVRIRIFSDWFS